MRKAFEDLEILYVFMIYLSIVYLKNFSYYVDLLTLF